MKLNNDKQHAHVKIVLSSGLRHIQLAYTILSIWKYILYSYRVADKDCRGAAASSNEDTDLKLISLSEFLP